MDNDKKSRSKLLIILLLLITICCIGITVWAVFFRNTESGNTESEKTESVLAPDRAPEEKEENAEAIENDNSEKMKAEEGGGAVSITYSNEVTIDLNNKTASLLFANPSKSTQNMVVQIIIKDTEIVQSGLLEPGNQVTQLDLLENAEKQLEKGGYDGKFRVLFYDPDSGQKAAVNTEIPISITVE